MADLDVLLRAHEVNENLRLGLTPAQIARALDRHERATAAARKARR